ncbi:uncharacterized protein A4U43_C07F30480 [Asparagus officinalis]|uniref:Uncharacterized protein n=1 Tax=Asparagus officinalis TaxID=4686 RepID=A0A5P1EG06_ASPOF|nr:uncharacterized protein LOC109847741 [Asparagus officinalis]ONK64836.1 uncharacterized protein A4U43_C07F30480 [Asparagus officinalis]
MTSSFDVVGRAPPELLWAGVPHSSHLMALLRASQMQNSNPSPSPNPNSSFILNPVRAKEEGGLIGGGAMMSEPQLPMFRNESPAYHYQQQQNMLLSEAPTSSGIQELYQRLRSSSMNSDHLQVMSNNVSSPGVNANCFPSAVAAPVTAVSVMSTASSIMEPIPLTGGDFGYWNPMMTWPDISTANGAFP